MKYLTPEIAALIKFKNTKTLFKPNVSCGIFQDCNTIERENKMYYHVKTSNK